jgi:hypothetical protein
MRLSTDHPGKESLPKLHGLTQMLEKKDLNQVVALLTTARSTIP